MNAKGQGRIYNVSGQMVMEINLQEDELNTLDLKELEQGVYFLELVKENGERMLERFSKISEQ